MVALTSLLTICAFAIPLDLPTPSAAVPVWFQDLTGLRTRRIQRHVRSAVMSNGRSSFDLVLLHANDMHARFEQTNRLSGVCSPYEAEKGLCYGGYGRMASIIKDARESARKGESPPVLVLNAGDTFQGTLYYTLFKAEIATKFTNMLDFDALSLGNHEFDDGPEGLEPFLRGVKRPIIAANVDISKSPVMKGINLPPSVVLDIGGRKVGIIGYLTQETSFLSNPGDVIITNDIEAVKKEAKRLTQQGIKIIIALGHSGYQVDQQIAEEVPELDIVVGGHSHTFLFNNTVDPLPDNDIPSGMYPTIVTQKSGKKVPVVQAYAFTKYLGRLLLSFDDNGELTSIEGRPLLLDKTIPEDPEIVTELKKWQSKLDDYTNKIEGNSPILLDSQDCRHHECNIGSLIADAYIYYRVASPARNNTPGWTDAPIAIMNGGSVRTSIDARTKNNSITLRDILDVMPFSNMLTIVKVKGDALMEILEHGVSRYDPALADNKGAFLQMSGLQVTYNINKPSGQRVESALARCGDCDVPRYSPVKDDETYTFITNSFLANGGDGYSMVPEKGEVTLLDDVESQAFITYLNEQSPVYPEVGFRITFNKSGATLNHLCTLALLPSALLSLLSTLRRALAV